MELLYFILGFLSAQFLIPLLDNLLVLILTKIEVKKSEYSEIINQSNINMRQASDAADLPQRLIGFRTTDVEEEEDDDL